MCTIPLKASYQVALRVYRNKTAADADRLGQWFDPDRRQKGPVCLLNKNEFEEVSRSMIAYAALQVRSIRWQVYILAEI